MSPFEPKHKVPKATFTALKIRFFYIEQNPTTIDNKNRVTAIVKITCIWQFAAMSLADPLPLDLCGIAYEYHQLHWRKV